MMVKDMPYSVCEACVERGESLDAELTPLEAMKEYAGWHLGDPEWAEIIISYYERMQQPGE